MRHCKHCGHVYKADLSAQNCPNCFKWEHEPLTEPMEYIVSGGVNPNEVCTCDARFSGIDEAEYQARGCPECTCKKPRAKAFWTSPEGEEIFIGYIEGDILPKVTGLPTEEE